MSNGLNDLTKTAPTPFQVLVLKPLDQGTATAHVPWKTVTAQSLADVILHIWPPDSAFAPTGAPGAPTWWSSRANEPQPIPYRLWTPEPQSIPVDFLTPARCRIQGNDIDRTQLVKAVARARSAVTPLEEQVATEVEARSALRRTDVGGDRPGDYEGVLARVEALLGDKKDEGPACQTCCLYWEQRRRLPDGRTRLFAHLTTAGHVALELGLDDEAFRLLADKQAHGVPLVATPGPAVEDIQPMRDLAEGLQLQLVYAAAWASAGAPTQLLVLRTVLANAEAAATLLEAIDHPLLPVATKAVADTLAAIAKIATT